MSSRPPLPPVTRLMEPPPVHTDDQPHTIPGWVAALIYLACLVVLGWAIIDRML